MSEQCLDEGLALRRVYGCFGIRDLTSLDEFIILACRLFAGYEDLKTPSQVPAHGLFSKVGSPF